MATAVAPHLGVVNDFQIRYQRGDFAVGQQELSSRSIISFQVRCRRNIDQQQSTGCQRFDHHGKEIALQIMQAADHVPGAGRERLVG